MPEMMTICLNGEDRDVGQGETVADLVRALGLAPEQVAVERNGALVPRLRHAETPLTAGDVLEVVTLVGGG